MAAKVKKTTIAEKVRFYRRRGGISQLKLEIEANLGSGTISRIESGKISPSKETLHKIAAVLELDAKETSYLFGVNLYSGHNHLMTS